MDEVEGARSHQTASDGADHACGPCKYGGDEKKATHFCNDCKEFLCSVCSNSHKGLKMSRNHKLVPITDWSANSAASSEPYRVFCECSMHLVVIKYCEEHDDVICQSCATLKHRKCKTISVSKIAESYAEENFKLISLKANTILAKIDEYIKCRNKDINTLTNMKEKYVKNVKAFKQELGEILDRLEKESLEDLDKKEPTARQKIELNLPACYTTKEMLQNDLKLFDDIQKSSMKTDMFAADILLSKRFKEYNKILQDINQESISPHLYFIRNKQLSDMDKLGNLIIDDKPKLFTHLKIVSYGHAEVKMSGDKTMPNITGCTVMPDGKIVLCDVSDKSVRVLNDSFKIEKKMFIDGNPIDVSVLNNTDVIITVPDRQQLQCIEVRKSSHALRVMAQLDQQCWGIDVIDKEVYVACHDNPGNGQIKILDINGILKRSVVLAMYDTPTRITGNAKSGKIYLSDRDTSSVACLMLSGKVIYEYKDKNLVCPRKVCFDEEDNILVCGEKSDIVQIVTAAGNKHSTLLTATNGIRNPRCAAYRQMDKTLIIACSNDDKLHIFRTE